jgi:hypothetical protein
VEAALARRLAAAGEQQAIGREFDHVALAQLTVWQCSWRDVHHVALARAHVPRGANDEPEPVHLAGSGEDFSSQ